jgi:hypothetical protein
MYTYQQLPVLSSDLLLSVPSTTSISLRPITNTYTQVPNMTHSIHNICQALPPTSDSTHTINITRFMSDNYSKTKKRTGIYKSVLYQEYCSYCTRYNVTPPTSKVFKEILSSLAYNYMADTGRWRIERNKFGIRFSSAKSANVAEYIQSYFRNRSPDTVVTIKTLHENYCSRSNDTCSYQWFLKIYRDLEHYQ